MSPRTCSHSGLRARLTASIPGDGSTSVSSKRDFMCDALLPPPLPSSRRVRSGRSQAAASAFAKKAASSAYSEGSESSGHHDLALAAVQDALVLDEQLQDHRHLAEDLLTQGNIQMQLGRVDDAEVSYERALARSLEHGHMDNAASASTNLAILLANSGRLPQAIARLQESLAYLLEQPHLPTEIHTRLALIQAVDAAQADAAIAVDAARGLFGRPATPVDAPQWQAVEEAFERCLGRYLAEHAELDAQAWKAETFPQLFSMA